MSRFVPAVLRETACQMLRLSRARAVVECEALARVFEEDLPDDRRTLVLDLLAGAGTPEAQVVMRRLLSLDVVRRDPSSVEGDGVSTVRDLIRTENHARVDAEGARGNQLVHPDHDCLLALRSQQLTLA